MTGASILGWTVQFLVMVGCIPIHGSCHHAYSRLEPQQHSKRSVLVLCMAMACSQFTKAASAASPTAMPRHVCLHKLLCDFFLFFLFAGLTVQVINLIHGFLARPKGPPIPLFMAALNRQFQWGNEVLKVWNHEILEVFFLRSFPKPFYDQPYWKKRIGATKIYPIVFGISKIFLQYIQNRSNYIPIYPFSNVGIPKRTFTTANFSQQTWPNVNKFSPEEHYPLVNKHGIWSPWWI